MALDVSMGGSTNTVLHLLAAAHEAQVEFTMADIDRISRHYTGNPYPRRDRGRVSAWIVVDGWHGWGALKDSSQAG